VFRKGSDECALIMGFDLDSLIEACASNAATL
jgi:hypothetical protein